MDKGQKASLGCGTLIVIALIVLIFGNMGGKDTAMQVQDLRKDIWRLEEKIQAQSRQIESMDRKLSAFAGATSQASNAVRPSSPQAVRPGSPQAVRPSSPPATQPAESETGLPQ